jgi:hypothetical protein
MQRDDDISRKPFSLDSFQFHAQGARLYAFGNAHLEHLHDLLHRGPVFQGNLDVPSRVRSKHGGDGGVERNAQ